MIDPGLAFDFYLDGLAVFVLLDELEGVVGLDLDDVDEPVEGVRVAVHRDLDALGLLHLRDHLREVRDGASVFPEPFSLEEDLLEGLLLCFGGLSVGPPCGGPLLLAGGLAKEDFDVVEIEGLLGCSGFLGWSLSRNLQLCRI